MTPEIQLMLTDLIGEVNVTDIKAATAKQKLNIFLDAQGLEVKENGDIAPKETAKEGKE